MPKQHPQKPARKSSPKKAAAAISKSGRMAKPDGRAAVEGWLGRVKPELQPLARGLDALILAAMPDAVCAVKWGVPFYGLPGQGWIAAVNSFKAHVKLLFFGGRALKPRPPAGKGHNAVDFHSGNDLHENEQQVTSWLNQAKQLPGWNLKNFPSRIF